MNEIISIIIPVYKVERYLEQCVYSIVNQTYRHIEIILVDDGSPDKSGELADRLAQEDGRICVLHKKNGGLSSARNVGLSIAKGDYVMFLDSDDFWMDNTCLERLVSEFKKTPDCDFIGFNCFYYYARETEIYKPWVAYDNNIVNERKKEPLIIKLIQTGTFPMSACLKIIKRDLLLDNKIEFINGIIAEDIPWFLELLRKAKGFRMLNDYIYVYRQTSEGSISHTFSLKGYIDLFNTVKSEILLIEKSEFNKDTKDALLSFLAYEWCILLARVNRIEDKKIRSNIRRELKDFKCLLKYTVNPKVAKVSKLYRVAGFRITEFVLRRYLANKT